MDAAGQVRSPRRVAGVSALGAGVFGLAFVALYLQQPALGFEDTDNPALGVRFAIEYPQLLAWSALALFGMAIALTVASAGLAEMHRDRRPHWAVTTVTAFGLVAAACLLVFGSMRAALAGPLVHIAGLRQDWGESAYLVVQMAGVQGLMPAGLLALALWAAGWSWLGWRSRTLPLAVCLLGLLPAAHVLGRVVGPWLAQDSSAGWVLVVASVPGTMLWCLALGLALLVTTPRRAQSGVDG